ncbi:MAG: hypothetical protein E5V88_17435 [Mesorhizobium sp.]|nr:MAG: hypothetical protein E5V88_17435 [Mesorhizobium sp.]
MATTQISGAGGTTTSFSNTPQAQGDVFNYSEDTAVVVSGSQSIILLDVLANDLGGNAKTLYSIDDGTSATTSTKQPAPLDLTTQDYQTSGISAWEDIGGGVRIRINNGKVEMDLSQYLQQHYGLSSLQALGAGDQINETFTYAIKLGNGTLSWASVNVNIQGTNDGATITAAPGADSAVVEAGGVANGTLGDPSAHGQLIISDVDAGQNHFQTPPSLQGTYGTFTFDTASGAWTYALTQALADPLTQGQHVTDTLTVKSADGTASYDIVVNIDGTNDAAVLSADVRNLTETDAAADISSSGQLTISDVDSPASFVAQVGTAGTYGTFAIDSAGAWTYTASSAHNEFAAGTTYTDTFDVVSADGTHTSVTINIDGTNDAAVLSADVRNLTETDAAADISSSGQLTISDVDSPASFVAQVGTAGTYGTFAIDSAGAWTYTASSAHNEFAAGTTYTDTFDVVSADGTHTSVTINIDGTNDGPAAVGDNVITNLAAGSAVIIPEWALIANDPGSAIDVSGVGSATGGTVSHSAGTGANGTVTFADTAPMGGTFTYTATDGTAAGAPALVTITQDNVATLDGTSGNDILVSSNGGATLVGGTGNDILLGGSGNDTYQFGLADGHDIISDVGSGGDSIQIVTSAPLDSTSIGTLNFERVSNDLVIDVGATEITVRDQYVGSGNVESIQFTNGGTVYGYALSSSSYRLQTTLSGGGTDDVIASTSAGQALTGGNGNDLLFGNGGDDSTINGGSGNDLIVGGTGNDTLVGGGDNDTLVGGDGNDTLTGGAGIDTLTGGIGSDIFNYGSAVSDSPASAANDIITDFVHGVDKIDLSSIDANTASGGDQAFLFGGFNANTVANSITWSEVGGNTIVHVDVTGNTTADFQITLTGINLGLTASDFVL